MVAVAEGACARRGSVTADSASQTADNNRPLRNWMPCPGPGASTFQLYSGLNASKVAVMFLAGDQFLPSSSE